MRKSKFEKVFSYAFSNLEIPHNEFVFTFDGVAFWHLEDLGNGSFEYWGMKGVDSFLVADFFSVQINDWKVKKRTRDGLGWEEAGENEIFGMTANDRQMWEEIILENLHDNRELCESLPAQNQPPE